MAYDEPIWIVENGELRREKIGKLVDEYGTENQARNATQALKQRTKLLTFTLDDAGKAVVSPIDGFIRHEAPAELYQITTQTGRKIKTTADHALFTLANGFVSATPTSKLVAGESRIAVPSHLPVLERDASWNLVEAFKDDENVFVEPSLLFSEAISKVGVENAALLLGRSRRYVAKHIGRAKNALPLPLFRRLMSAASLGFDAGELVLSYRGSKQTVPGALNANTDLAYVLGFWAAEGDYNRCSLRFSNHNPENRRELTEALGRLGIHSKAYVGCIRAENPLFQMIFKRVMKMAPYAQNKHAPAFIFSAPSSQIAAFLRGYYSGDGSVHGNSHRSYVEASTSSETLASDVQHLLLHFGIVSSIAKSREKRTGENKFKVLFSGVTNFERFREVGFSQSSKQGRLLAYPAAKKWRRSAQIPLDAQMRAFLAANGFGEWVRSETIGIDILRQALERGDVERKFKNAWELVESDYYWDKVVTVEKIAYDKPFVYDISVPGSQRFLAGAGDLLVHNSEKGMREVFRKARMASPCIIFFDEIDSVAPSRVGGEHEGSRVTEQLVNQLLSEMDGLSVAKDVVVIAATNRPDIIDPALLRPGRFDKLIEIPAPDEAARLQVLKVHTAHMPLVSDVNLPELAKKTEGYSGADLSGLVREAGMHALRENAEKVSHAHFEKALGAIRPSLLKKLVREETGYG